ncbi:hypothetical protein [Mycolicibacterium monacense]|uniref:Uncharacterized protein n=3 Tax=Mycobacteriaceae TaxID=1762 RepID=A0AAD1IZU6_MYCMB|nr:hypothetical protein [Mycolicibacterium monacense]MDA4101609.1 hypothetical protein [Mycolicibacterium monacense DSM 44395]OBF52738.1 hypothetical protein A5778_12850 [Mycolicibacterium monacense]ORB13903.1 hypothetical protein BST34_24225 [Mycolicibacterium monacense DSM 44395]QHP87212.1 hypothetical protein EWR22_18640 [Mycolicibacterium monacense DSM 44395]BBZ59682.1 hypothetical protein MMON_09830 [Mycolicibacterium monacense]
MTGHERGLWLTDPGHRDDLATFAERAVRLDGAAVVRLRERAGGGVVAFVATGFDVLASRVVSGRLRPKDLCAGADALVAGLAGIDASGFVDTGFPMDSAWRGAVPSETGFTHLDDVPARVMLDLVTQGGALARQHSGAHGPPSSLLDQEVIAVSGDGESVGVPMRCVFALTAMGFLPQSSAALDAGDIVRIRVSPTWLRIDAPFGSVLRRRGDPAVVLR